MPVQRVATSSLHLQNLRDISKVQTDLAKLNRQISSGLKASTYTELTGVIERVSGYETKIGAIDTYLTNNNSLENRLNVMDQSVSQIQEMAEDFSSLLAMRRNPAVASGLNFKGQAQAILDNIVQSLNTSIEGRYLFSGSTTDIRPVPQPLPDLEVTGVPDDQYYVGNATDLTARISDELHIDYGVRANDPAFQTLIASIKTALEADEESNGSTSEAMLSKSLDLLNSSISELATVRAKIGSNITNLETVNEQHNQLKVYWKQAVSNDTETDIAEASIKLATDQTVLQATFQAFANLSRLRLTDFLN